MYIDRNATPVDQLGKGSPDPTDRWLSDCWLVEVMPPTWAWAYRRLLNSGQDPQRFRNPIA